MRVIRKVFTFYKIVYVKPKYFKSIYQVVYIWQRFKVIMFGVSRKMESTEICEQIKLFFLKNR